MQKVLQNPSLHPFKLAALYVGLFVIYIMLPSGLDSIRHILSPIMLGLLVVTGLSAFGRLFQA